MNKNSASNKGNTKNFVIIFGIFIVSSAIRVFLNNNQYIANIIAAINIIAFWYVSYLILEKSEDIFDSRISSDDVLGEHTKTKKTKHFKNMLIICKWLIFIFGLIYIFIFAHYIVNDIISFFNLFLSIETDYIYDFIQAMFYKKK